MQLPPLFFKRRSASLSRPPEGKIEVFSRHCLVSEISKHKERLPGFSQEKCFRNLLATIDFDKANLTCLFDRANDSPHYLDSYENTIRFEGGSEAASFLFLLDLIEQKQFPPHTLIYLVEDDYLHREGWPDVLLEGFSIPEADYVTLYDHRDKYFEPMYRKLSSKIFATKSCHWRTAPSTTHTFATRVETLLKDLNIHRKFSMNRKISADHQKFLALQKKGRTLLSSIPGYSTHAEPKFASPCIDWKLYLER